MIQNLNQSAENATFWQKHIDQFQAAGQTKTKYCKQHELNYHRFLYWYTKLTKTSAHKSQPADLIPVHVMTPKATEPKDCIANLELASGVKIKLFDEAVLFKLIESVG